MCGKSRCCVREAHRQGVQSRKPWKRTRRTPRMKGAGAMGYLAGMFSCLGCLAEGAVQDRLQAAIEPACLCRHPVHQTPYGNRSRGTAQALDIAQLQCLPRATTWVSTLPPYERAFPAVFSGIVFTPLDNGHASSGSSGATPATRRNKGSMLDRPDDRRCLLHPEARVLRAATPPARPSCGFLEHSLTTEFWTRGAVPERGKPFLDAVRAAGGNEAAHVLTNDQI
jgi:hypothetical protein